MCLIVHLGKVGGTLFNVQGIMYFCGGQFGKCFTELFMVGLGLHGFISNSQGKMIWNIYNFELNCNVTSQNTKWTSLKLSIHDTFHNQAFRLLGWLQS